MSERGPRRVGSVLVECPHRTHQTAGTSSKIRLIVHTRRNGTEDGTVSFSHSHQERGTSNGDAALTGALRSGGCDTVPLQGGG